MTEALQLEISQLKSENLNLKERVENLERLLITMKREKFGRKSERVVDDGSKQSSFFDLLNDEEKSFFNEAEVIDSASDEEKEEIEIKGYKRKKTKKTPLS